MRNKEKTKEKTVEIEKLYVIGPTETAKIMGWKHRSSFYKHFHEGHLPDIRSMLMLKGRYYVLEDVFREAYPEADENKLKKLMTEYRVKSGQKVKAIYINKGQLEEVNSQMLSEDQRFRKDVEELTSKDPNGCVRIYEVSSGGVKLKFRYELSLASAYFAISAGGIESYLHDCGGGDFCLKLISTKYGRNMLVGKYRFSVR